MSGRHIWALMLLSLRDPAQAARWLIGLGLPMGVRWIGLALVAILAVLLIGLTANLLPAQDLSLLGREMQAPLPGLAIQAGTILMVAGLMAGVGRLFGGQGSFADALLLMVWLEFLTLPLTLVQLVLLLTFPPATILVALAALVVFVRIFVVFAATLHGFRSLLAVAGAALATLFGVSLILGAIMVALGIEPLLGTV